MKKISGNVVAQVQIKTSAKNDLGETISVWNDYVSFKGFLDYVTGESGTAKYNAKIEDSTHIFLCDYVDLPEENEIRLVIKNKVYEVKLIDSPMGINYHLEIYLRYISE